MSPQSNIELPRSENELALRKFVAPEIVYGATARTLAGQYAFNLGLRRVLLVSDPGVKDCGWVEHVASSLHEYEIESELYLDCSENPRDFEVMQGAKRYRDASCDGIVVVGGGSPMDCAKGIGVVWSHGRHINEFEGVDRLTEASPPLICIPTTAGSAAEVSQFAIITNTQVGKKIALAAKGLVPDIALLDPETTMTMSDEVTSATGVDVFVHACEAFVSTANSPITDIHALEAAAIVYQCLPQLLAERQNLYLRSRMLRASMEAGLAFSNAILGAVHATSHAVGGRYDAVHGVCNGILLPAVIHLNWQAAEKRYRVFARALGIELPSDSDEGRDCFVEAVRSFLRLVENPVTFREVGLSDLSVDILADFALADPCMVTNPYRPSKDEVIQLYEVSRG